MSKVREIEDIVELARKESLPKHRNLPRFLELGLY